MANEPEYDALEPDEFWDQHKTKIITYAVLVVVLLGGWGIYAWNKQTTLANSQAALAVARTPEALSAVIRDHAGTVVAGTASLELAEAHRNAGEYDKALEVLRAFIDKYPKHPLIAGGWLGLASTQELQGKKEEALKAYRDTVTRFPNDYTAPLALMAQGRLLVAEGKPDEARQAYQEVVTRFQESTSSREAMRELRALDRGTATADEPAGGAVEATPTPGVPGTDSAPPEVTPQ